MLNGSKTVVKVTSQVEREKKLLLKEVWVGSCQVYPSANRTPTSFSQNSSALKDKSFDFFISYADALLKGW